MSAIWSLIKAIIARITPLIAAMGFAMLCASWVIARRFPVEFSWLARKAIVVLMVLSLYYVRDIPNYIYGGFKQASLDTYLVASVGESPLWLEGVTSGVWIFIHGGIVLVAVLMELKSLKMFGDE